MNMELWARFDQLAHSSEVVRKDFFDSGGHMFAAAVVEGLMKNATSPEIANAEAFSDFIVKARANYREWNQNLMSLMVSHNGDASNTKFFAAYISDCPWLVLAEAAQDYLDSKCS
jgi:hypothetical protein